MIKRSITSFIFNFIGIWSLLYSQTPELFVAPLWHSAELSAMDISPDEKRAITGDVDGRLVLWDIQAKKGIKKYTGAQGVASVSFTHDDGQFMSLHRSSDTGGTLRINLWEHVSSAPIDSMDITINGESNFSWNKIKDLLIHDQNSVRIIKVENKQLVRETIKVEDRRARDRFLDYQLKSAVFSSYSDHVLHVLRKNKTQNYCQIAKYHIRAGRLQSVEKVSDELPVIITDDQRTFPKEALRYLDNYRNRRRVIFKELSTLNADTMEFVDIVKLRYPLSAIRFDSEGNTLAIGSGHGLLPDTEKENIVPNGQLFIKKVGHDGALMPMIVNNESFPSYESWKVRYGDSKDPEAEYEYQKKNFDDNFRRKRAGIQALTWLDKDQKIFSISRDHRLLINNVSDGTKQSEMDNGREKPVIFSFDDRLKRLIFNVKGQSAFWNLNIEDELQTLSQPMVLQKSLQRALDNHSIKHAFSTSKPDVFGSIDEKYRSIQLYGSPAVDTILIPTRQHEHIVDVIPSKSRQDVFLANQYVVPSEIEIEVEGQGIKLQLVDRDLNEQSITVRGFITDGEKPINGDVFVPSGNPDEFNGQKTENGHFEFKVNPEAEGVAIYAKKTFENCRTGEAQNQDADFVIEFLPSGALDCKVYPAGLNERYNELKEMYGLEPTAHENAIYRISLTGHDEKSVLATYPVEKGTIEEIRLSQDENYVAARYADHGNHFYELWNVQTKERKTFDMGNTPIMHLAFSRTSTHFVRYYNNNTESYFVITDTRNDSILCNHPWPVKIKNLTFREPYKELLIIEEDGSIHYFDYDRKRVTKTIQVDPRMTAHPEISPDGNYLYLQHKDEKILDYILVNLNSAQVINKFSVDNPITKQPLNVPRKRCLFLKDHFILTGNDYGHFELFDLSSNKKMADLRLFENGHWAIYTPEGAFDGDKGGRQKMYYVVDNEIVEFDQLKGTYWEPYLLQRILNRKYRASRYQHLDDIPLYPDLDLQISEDYDSLFVSLTKRTGGIGQVSIFVNYAEHLENINQNRKETIQLSTKDIMPLLISGESNIISAVAYDSIGLLHSRPVEIVLDFSSYGSKGDGAAQRLNLDTSEQKLFALLAGTSTYDPPKRSLKFADKDAEILEDAIQKIGKGIFRENISTFLLTSSGTGESKTSRENILAKLAEIQQNATANDLILLFLSGHGSNQGKEFYYLTQEIRNTDIQSNLDKYAISASELEDEIKKIKASKKVLILDACYSGQAAKIFASEKSDNMTSTRKALEILEGKTGMYVLASSGASKESWEVDQLGHGILTYSLLMGLSGQVPHDEHKFIRIGQLLHYASSKSEELAREWVPVDQTPVIAARDQASSFPIGIISSELNWKPPKGVPKIGSPFIGLKSIMTDPINFMPEFTRFLRLEGTFNNETQFLFLENTTGDDIYHIRGTYEEGENGQYILSWYLLKNNKLIGIQEDYQTIRVPKDRSEYDKIFAQIIGQAISLINQYNE